MKQFIEVTDDSLNVLIFINVANIVYAAKDGDRCRIYVLGKQGHINITESYEYVKQLIL